MIFGRIHASYRSLVLMSRGDTPQRSHCYRNRPGQHSLTMQTATALGTITWR